MACHTVVLLYKFRAGMPLPFPSYRAGESSSKAVNTGVNRVRSRQMASQAQAIESNKKSTCSFESRQVTRTKQSAKKCKQQKCLTACKKVPAPGFEHGTYCLRSSCSNQLSYAGMYTENCGFYLNLGKFMHTNLLKQDARSTCCYS